MKILLSLMVGALFLLTRYDNAPHRSNAYRSSLTVNGLPLASDTLSFNSQGMLALVEGDLKWSKRKAVPYQALLHMGSSAQSQRDSTFTGLQTEIWPPAWVRDEVIDPEPSKHKPLPFRLSLRRSGAIVCQWPAHAGEGLYSIQLTKIWLLARLGDELIVEPLIGSALQSVESRGKRVIKLEKVNRPVQGGC